MANEYPTMLDLAKKNGTDSVVGLIEENLAAYPEAALFPAKTIAGTEFKTFHRVDYADPGFRLVNEGVETKKASYQQKLVECFYLDGHIELDEALVGADDDNISSLLALEADSMAKGIMRRIGRQVWYGTGLDAKGFAGASQIVPSGLTVDAEGTTASTGSSVYLVIFGQQNAQLVFGRDSVLTMNEIVRQRITRSDKHLFAYLSNISGWVGVQWINPYCVGRIKDLTEDSGKTLTDGLVADLLAKFPDDAVVSGSNARLFMTKRSARQLQKSRSATSVNNFGNRTATGVEIVAPWPTESNGIPITITSGLTNTETLT